MWNISIFFTANLLSMLGRVSSGSYSKVPSKFTAAVRTDGRRYKPLGDIPLRRFLTSLEKGALLKEATAL
jgi:hypothetical protein